MSVMRCLTWLSCMGFGLATTDAHLIHVPGLGTAEGVLSDFSSAVAVFRGIPYAKPPIGDLRWRPPLAYGPWTGTLDATSFGSSCFTFEEKEPQESEDCLFMNVATSVTASNRSKWPVMVYIHGGAYTSGDTRHAHIDSLVARSDHNIVVASMNYRLNVFGFLGSTMLKDRSTTGSFGNYGIEDQRLALRWVRDHIASFGGHGHHVTIFGESAGGNSVIQHLTQPWSFGLYSKAIIESGAYIGSKPVLDAEAQFQTVLNATACADLNCLLNVSGHRLATSVQKLWEANPSAFTMGPVIDGAALLASPQQLIDSGKYNNKVPVVIGSNRDEASFFVIRDHLLPQNASEADLDVVLAHFYSQLNASEIAMAKRIYAEPDYSFPAVLGNYSKFWWIAMRMATDGVTGLGPCTVRRLARMLVQGKSPAVFTYVFDHPSQEVLKDMNEGLAVPGTELGSTVVPHASELPYVFSWLEALNKDAGESDLALSMSRYWQQFASKGDPNDASLPFWPAYNTETDVVLGFDVGLGGIHTHHKLRRAACDFWEDHMGWPRANNAVPVLV